MRALAVGGLVAGLGFFAAPAYATFHLEKVNEVMLASSTGDAHVQFVELLDKGGTEEQFTPVFAPYKLVVYDGAGNRLGEHMLDPNGLRAAAGSSSPYLISTVAADAAFGVKGDEQLDVTLPAAAGQACFEGNPSPSAFSCITWGTITKPVPTNSNGTGSAHGPVPPPGESDQRQADDTVVAAAPTPKAPNRAASGGPPPPATPFAGVSFPARTAHVDTRGRAAVRVSCPAAASGSCKGTLKLIAKKGGASVGHASFDIAAGRTATVFVKLSRSARAQLKRVKRLHVRARVTASDGSGTRKQTQAALTLVRGARDTSARELLSAHNALVRAQIREHNGYEVKSQGDGFMVAFPSARKALRAAIAIQRAIDGYDEERMRVRIGLHTGEAIHRDGDFFGKSVTLAARIADEASGGEILVSALVRELTEASCEFEFARPRRAELRGLGDDYTLYPVRWRDGAEVVSLERAGAAS